jgi:hypothetical protein
MRAPAVDGRGLRFKPEDRMSRIVQTLLADYRSPITDY